MATSTGLPPRIPAEIRIRVRDAAELTRLNPVLSRGEPIAEFTPDGGTFRLKVGDGVRPYTELPYVLPADDGGAGATDLAITRSPTELVITSSTGDDATLPAASDSEAGVMTAEDKAKLDALPADATSATTSIINAYLFG